MNKDKDKAKTHSQCERERDTEAAIKNIDCQDQIQRLIKRQLSGSDGKSWG